MGMFRQKALVKLQSPEQLDVPLMAIRRKTATAITVAFLMVSAALVWSVLGKLPENGRGQGIVVTPNSVIPVQAQADGQIGVWYVSVGDVVKEGQLMGLLEQPVIAQELQQTKAKLAEVEARNEMLTTLRNQFSSLEQAARDKKRKTLKARAVYLEKYTAQTKAFAAEVNKRNGEALTVQRTNLASNREAEQQISQAKKERVESYKRLRAEKLVSEDALNTAIGQYDDSKVKLQELDLQIEQLDLKRVELKQTFLEATNLIATRENTLADLNLRLRELDNQEAQSEKLENETDFRNKNEIAGLKRTIERLEKQLLRDREIRSDAGGRILELTAAEGNIVNRGQRLIQMETRKETDQLIALAYFQDKVGKRLFPGMVVRVAPSTVDTKRYGSIRGKVISVSELPVTPDAVINYVGNSEVARDLTKGEHHVEAFIEMMEDPTTDSGYAWTSQKGPSATITPGTSIDVNVTYERRPPISFVMPKLREWSGLALSNQLGFDQ